MGLIGVTLLRDTARATAKSVAGICTPPNPKRTTRACVFFCAAQLYPQFQLWRAGQGSPRAGRSLWVPVVQTLFSSSPDRDLHLFW
ncbi:ash family protein [Aeromonas caviae]|nr:ash family protein [Aeromonas caviae]